MISNFVSKRPSHQSARKNVSQEHDETKEIKNEDEELGRFFEDEDEDE